MGLFDAAVKIGTSLISGALGDSKGSSSNTVIAPQYGSSLIQPLKGAEGQKSATEKRSEEEVVQAQTQKEKGKVIGDDPIALAKLWNDLFKEAEETPDG